MTHNNKREVILVQNENHGVFHIIDIGNNKDYSRYGVVSRPIIDNRKVMIAKAYIDDRDLIEHELLALEYELTKLRNKDGWWYEDFLDISSLKLVDQAFASHRELYIGEK